MANTYYEKLKDPRWQKKRLQVLDRDEWTCTRCGAKDKTFNVLHWVYAKSGNPWDVKDDYLDTLCEDCHSKVESMIVACKFMIQKFKNLDFALMVGDEDSEMTDFFFQLFDPNSAVHKNAKLHFRSLKKKTENG